MNLNFASVRQNDLPDSFENQSIGDSPVQDVISIDASSDSSRNGFEPGHFLYSGES